MNGITTQVISSFDDPAVRPELWARLLDQGDTRTGILTWQSQKLWWQENQQLGDLLLIVASRDGEARVIAPLFAASGMAMNLCPVNRLDFIGDVGDSELLDAILVSAARQIKGFAGVRIHFVPDTSRSGRLLQEAAGRLNLSCFLEDDQVCPIIDIRGKPEMARACAHKKIMLRRENQLKREGTMAVHHFREAADVLPQLDAFFEQHVQRWEGTETPSKFRDHQQRESFRLRTAALAEAGWLRFSRLDWNGRPIAFHRGSCFQRQYNYGRATYAADLARYSPGTVLMRHLLLAAIDEGADTFDFGIGDESYKFRYATDVIHIQTWGLYPTQSA